ncbi:MAG: hypothetical protein ACAI34_04690 [Verrucomicrobium sp.]
MPHRLPLTFSRSLFSGLSAVFLVGLSVTSKDSSAAQDVTPEREMRSLKMQLRQDLLTAMLPEKRKQMEELIALEKKLATTQNYAGALRARDERLKLEKEISNIEKELPALRAQAASLLARSLPERIELKLSEAQITGLKLDSREGTLGGWQTPGASAAWKLPDLPPGGYEVVMRYSSDDGGIVLKESFYSLAVPCGTATKAPAERSVGTLRIRDGNSSLTLTANPPEKSATLRVYSLSLVPASR